MNKIIEWTLYGAAVALITLLTALIVVSIRADGRTDYCYLQVATPGSDTPLYHRLYQHRPYRTDLVAGSFQTAAEAVEMAKTMGCPLH